MLTHERGDQRGQRGGSRSGAGFDMLMGMRVRQNANRSAAGHVARISTFVMETMGIEPTTLLAPQAGSVRPASR
jgi:hypothetical protein